MPERLEIPKSGKILLPNGCTLYWREGDMGREYFSDEVGGGVHVWTTCLVDPYTLLAAVVQEGILTNMERVNKERGF